MAKAAAEASAKAEPGVFKSTEVRSSNFKPFKKWQSAIERYLEQAKTKEGPCTETKLNRCLYNHWMAYLDEIRGLDKMEQLKKVNRYMNQRSYITDPKNWSQKDFWATPGEFLDKRGDCEDYAIAKYMSLKKLGFDEMSLRIIAVKDENLKVGHAILGVYLNGKIYILDNQVKQVTEDTSIRHYTPVFSINEKYWWRHRR
ncbi:transglutaminase-like cysteine peptidase [Magnetospira thiophila]